MNRNVILAIVVIAVIGVAGFGVYLMIQPVHNPNNIAIVFATGGLGDKSFNDGVKEGADKAKSLHNINFTYSEPGAIGDYESMIRGYARHAGLIEPYDLIISVGFDQADAVMKVAEEYPNQQFAIIDMFIDPVNYTNVASVLFTENQGSALVGAIAGMYTTTGQVGFLGGMDIPLIRKFAAGYFWGANYTYFNYENPGNNMTTTAQYVGDWANIPSGKTLTSGMYTGGADIVFAAAGRSGLGAFEAALEENATSSHPLWVIGVDSPQMYLGCEDEDNPEPPTVGLTSMLKRVDVATYDLMYDAVLGTYTSGLKFYDLSNDGHDYEVNEDLLTLRPDVVDVVEMIRVGIINGTFVIPDDY
ncbi:BMP family ABC transporter substrate-binding protein [Candidatus Thorarchaeota archaeon]|nr:MAG: BMP family ABC transporter substrate-binding protein [Candidatus Thorarchaeota archaeon]